MPIPSIMSGKGARVYAYTLKYPTPPGNVTYNPLDTYRGSLTNPDNRYQTFSDWSLSVKSDLQKRTTTISHGEQYLPGIMSGEITLNGLLSYEGSMGYYLGQLVVIHLDWSVYFTAGKKNTKNLRIPVTIAGMDRTASVKDAYKVTINGKLNWIYDPFKAPKGWFVRSKESGSRNPGSDYGYTPVTPAIRSDSPANAPNPDSPFYI